MNPELRPNIQRTEAKSGVIGELQSQAEFSRRQVVTHVSIVGTVPFRLNSLPLSFLTVCHMEFKDAEVGELQEQFHTFRTLRGYVRTSDMAFFIQHIRASYIALLPTGFNVKS
jgi:hypothetical protein